MIDWVYGLPLAWLIVVVFAGTLAVAELDLACRRQACARAASRHARRRVSRDSCPHSESSSRSSSGSWLRVSGTTLRLLGLQSNEEAGALRAADLLVGSFPAADAARMRALLRAQIALRRSDRLAGHGARQEQTITVIPAALANASEARLAASTPRRRVKVSRSASWRSRSRTRWTHVDSGSSSASRVSTAAKWAGVVAPGDDHARRPSPACTPGDARPRRSRWASSRRPSPSR